MVSQHCHWRTVEEWRDLNVPLSTPSNEASRMYDATLTQLTAFWDDPSVGGIPATLKLMMDADPNFVVGQAMTVGLQLLGTGTSTRRDPKLKTTVEDLVTKAEGQPNLAPAEKKHVKAVKQWADGYLREACVTWEDILVDHPHDLLALRSAYMSYIYTGNSAQIRDSPARVLPEWSPSTPLYSFLLGMHAFGLEETNMYDRAEKQALRALELNRHDTWATHSMSHVLEMTGQQDRGIHFLRSTLDNWEVCGSLACHNWWHLALHYIEKGEYLEALEIFDSEVKSRCVKQRELFNIADAASLLFRLELEGMNVVNKWKDIQDVSESHLGDAVFAFNDLHLMVSCLGSGDKKASQHFLESLEEHVRNGQGTTRDVHSHTRLKICQALTAYKEGDFAQATDIMYPLRYDVQQVGGSHAQRDVFNIFLIVSALQSPKAEDHRKASRMEKPTRNRLKRSSFVHQSRSLKRQYLPHLPESTLPLDATGTCPTPWEANQRVLEINTTVKGVTSRDMSDTSKKALTLAMIADHYPEEAWIHAYTDGSATDAVRDGGAGVLVRYPEGEAQTASIPTGLHCTNYSAEVQALKTAATIVDGSDHECPQVVFLTDAMSALHALSANKETELNNALQQVAQNRRVVLQWVPAHCDIAGNEAADKLAKEGASKEQFTSQLQYKEKKTIIKNKRKTRAEKDDYHLLQREEQVVLLRLRTGHNRLNHHMATKLKLVPSPLCPCGKACPYHSALRDTTWPEETALQKKLYGPREDLERTARFALQSGLTI